MPAADNLTDLQAIILNVLREHGGWMKRSELATYLGRPSRLVPHDIDMLEGLVTIGLVEREKREIGTVKTVAVYRAVT